MASPKVGVGVIICKDNKVLMSKRRGDHHGEGCWGFVGGHLEFGEDLIFCAERETREETSVSITNARAVTFTNDIFIKENKHYLTIFVVADHESGEVKNMEPDRCETWEWFSWQDLPRPLFVPIENLLSQGFSPF